MQVPPLPIGTMGVPEGSFGHSLKKQMEPEEGENAVKKESTTRV